MSDLTDPPKYIVLKTEDWDAALRGVPQEVDDRLSYSTLLPADYFVIRRGDVFGAPALHAYAHTIMTALELDEAHDFLTEDQRSHLTELVDGLTDLAALWTSRGTKVPD